MVDQLQENLIYKISSFKYCIPEQQYLIPNSHIHFSRVQSTQFQLIGDASATDLTLLQRSRVFSTFKVVEDFKKRVMANPLDTESNMVNFMVIIKKVSFATDDTPSQVQVKELTGKRSLCYVNVWKDNAHILPLLDSGKVLIILNARPTTFQK